MTTDCSFPQVVELNVGGFPYTTGLGTLTKGGNHMLAAMFSGRHHVAKDKDGRYFIDADGALFSHILRYLRTGELPCTTMAPQVYREAKYFGLQELQRHIEQMPVMMGRHARLQFQNKLHGFDDAIDQILKIASVKQCILSDEVVSYAVISILREPQEIRNAHFDNNHICRVNLPLETISADICIGPWNNPDDEVTDRVYLRAIARDLECRGFTVTFTKQGTCAYGISDPDRIDCRKALFRMLFHWHKCC